MSKNSMLYRLKDNKGFMLAELTLAILIISVTLVAISGTFAQAIQADIIAKDYTVATNLAQKQLELLKTKPPEYWSGLTLPTIISWSDQGQLPASRYTLATNVMATDYNNLVQVIVTASWQERGIKRTIQLTTLYSAL